jgi:hypothetical protein
MHGANKHARREPAACMEQIGEQGESCGPVACIEQTGKRRAKNRVCKEQQIGKYGAVIDKHRTNRIGGKPA